MERQRAELKINRRKSSLDQQIFSVKFGVFQHPILNLLTEISFEPSAQSFLSLDFDRLFLDKAVIHYFTDFLKSQGENGDSTACRPFGETAFSLSGNGLKQRFCHLISNNV